MIDKVNNINFTGIKLSRSNPFSTRVVARQLKDAGFYCYGSKTYSIENYSDKKFVFDNIRFRNDFSDNEFGIIFFPEYKETYIIASPLSEQRMIPIVKKFDKKANVNLLF